MFKIEKKDRLTQARTGQLKTEHGTAKTPFFMPVATKATVKYISVQDLESMKAKAIISNAFVLFLRPGHKAIEKLGGIHKFMNYKGISFTDSGGFQMYKEVFLKKTNKDGIEFQSPIDGNTYFITPEYDMEIQHSIGSDVAMCLDSMPLIENSDKEIEDAVTKTTMWALRCKVHNKALVKKTGRKQLLFAITQGGIDKVLRKKSATELKNLDFDGYAIGGLALGEPKDKMLEMVKVHKDIIGQKKPCYLMGLGSPLELLEAISLGVDMFDSRFPTQNARRGTIFTSLGRLRVKRKEYALDRSALDKNCRCFVCKNYSKAYIHYQLRQKEGTGYRLATYHNLYYLQNLMRQAARKIKENKFKEFLDHHRRIYEKELTEET